MKRIMSIFACCSLLVLLLMQPSSADVTNYPDDYDDLQNAINATDAGGIVLVARGVFYEPQEISMKDGVDIVGSGDKRSDSYITCDIIIGASDCSLENLTIEATGSRSYVLQIPPTVRNMTVQGCFFHALKPILVEGSGVSFIDNVLDGDLSLYDPSALNLIIFKDNPETAIYPNLLRNNTLSVDVDTATPDDGYLLHLSNSGDIEIKDNICTALYNGAGGLEAFTAGKPILIDPTSNPAIAYNTYLGDISGIDQSYLEPGNIAAAALPVSDISDDDTALPDTSIAKSAGLVADPGSPGVNYEIEIGPYGNAPAAANVSPEEGSGTLNRREPFSAEVSSDIPLQQASLLLDGQEVYSEDLTGQTQATIYVQPTQDLSLGGHTYHLRVSNAAAYVTTTTRTFSVRRPSGCFLAGTPILMQDGTTKSIEELRVGDTLFAFDEATGEVKPDTVKHVFVFPNEEEYLVINGNLNVTPHHAFYVNDEWIEAGELKVGDTLLNASGAPEKIASIKHIKDTVTVYNLEVNPYHTFIAGGVIVHNAQMMQQQQRIIKKPQL